MSATFIRNCIAYRSSTGEDLYATLLETAESNMGNGDSYKWSVHHASSLDEVMAVERHLASVTYAQGIYWQPGRNGSGKHHMRRIEEAIACAMSIRPDERIPWVGEKVLLWLDEGNPRRKIFESWQAPEGFSISTPVSTMYLDCVIPTLRNLSTGLRFAKSFKDLTSSQGTLIAPEKIGIPEFDDLLESLLNSSLRFFTGHASLMQQSTNQGVGHGSQEDRKEGRPGKGQEGCGSKGQGPGEEEGEACPQGQGQI